MTSPSDDQPDGWPTFCCTYNYDGKKWGIDVVAPDLEDAYRRLYYIGHGTIDGELMARIPASSLGGEAIGTPLMRLACWFGNNVLAHIRRKV